MAEVITDNLDLWTSALLAKSTAGRGSNGKLEAYGIKKLRELILELAVRGKLVPQNANDEPASVLLEKISQEKARLNSEGRIRKQEQQQTITDSEKPFPIPSGWEWVRLGDAVEIVRGITFPASEKSRAAEEGRVACLRTTNVQDRIEWNDLLYVRREFVTRDEQFVRISDIVMSTANSRELVGKVAIVEHEPEFQTAFGGFLTVLRPILLDPSFVMVLLRTPVSRNALIDSASQTTNIANISIGKLNPLVLTIPPLAEQHRIVAKVDELMALCDQLEQQQTDCLAAHQVLVVTLLGTLTRVESQPEFSAAWARIASHFDTLFTTEASIDQLKQTILQLAVMGKLVPQDSNDEPASVLLGRIATTEEREATEATKKTSLLEIGDEEKLFNLPNGWSWVRGETIADFVDPHPSHRTPPEYLGGVPYVGYTDIDHEKGIDFENARKVDPKVFEEHQNRYQLKTGDFVFGKIGTLGEPFFLPEPFDYCLSANLILIQPNLSVVHPRYLAIFLDSPWFIGVMGEQKTNSTHSVFGIKKARLICLPQPPLAEQHRIVAKVDELMALCDAIKARFADAQIIQVHLADAIVEQAVC